MPNVRPFRGIRYTSSNLRNLVCPPYDVISQAEQQRLYERDPHNAVRLELAKTEAGPRRYEEVGELFERWLASGVLATDERDSLYAYRQDFTDESGRRRRVAGVIGELELEEFGTDSGVLPHERTMPGPIEDRLALLRACPVNISPIYAIYRGRGELGPFFDSLEDRPPSARAEHDGILHRLWPVTAAAEIEALSAAMRAGPLVIADGHHRYETALVHHREQVGAPGGHDAIMCFCVDADVEDLVVLPYHRALRARASADVIAARLIERFAARDADETALQASTADHPMLFVLPKRTLLVEANDEQVIQAVGPRAPAWRALDVVALHEAVLPQIADGQIELSFSRDAAEIRRLVERGWTAGILLRALDPAQIVEVARSGERMPQKASYFWPKAVTGMVFRSLR